MYSYANYTEKEEEKKPELSSKRSNFKVLERPFGSRMTEMSQCEQQHSRAGSVAKLLMVELAKRSCDSDRVSE